MAYAKGFIPHRYQDGRPYNGSGTRCVVADDYATALFVGDPVIMVDAGGMTIPTTSTSPSASDVMDGTYQIVERAAGGAAGVVWGVIVGVSTDRSDLSKQYIPASTGGTVIVARATTELIFLAGADATMAVTDLNEATDFNNGTGSTSTGYSGATIDVAGFGTASQLYVVGLHNQPGNSLADTDAIWEVTFQSIQFGQTPTGLGLSA